MPQLAWSAAFAAIAAHSSPRGWSREQALRLQVERLAACT